MRQMLWLCFCLVLGPCVALAAPPITITDQNSSLKYTTDEPGGTTGQPSDPLQLPRKVEWTVDGRRILVYPSSPSSFLDIAHLHPNLHVGANQMHAQGPLLGYGTGATTGSVLGGVVYTVSGAASGSGVSRITEKVDIHNKTTGDVPLLLAGFGFKSPQPALEVPDLSGLNLSGTTVVYFQGNAQTNSFTEPPFAPVTILPVVTFSGFNPLLNQNLNLPAGAHLTMITELKLTPAVTLITPIWIWIVAALVLAASLAAWVWRKRAQQG